MIKNSFMLSSTFSKTEDIFDFLIIPNQLINCLINSRLDLFNEIFNVINSARLEIPENDLIKNIYNISYKIKLIFLKAITKSILISPCEKPEDFFYFNSTYNFVDLYDFFKKEEIFDNFLIEKISDFSLLDNIEENISEEISNLIETYKFCGFSLFIFDLIFKNFEKKNEKMINNLESFYSLKNEKNLNTEEKEENLIIKDSYSLNFIIEKSNNRMLELFKILFNKIFDLLINEKENEFFSKGKIIY